MSATVSLALVCATCLAGCKNPTASPFATVSGTYVLTHTSLGPLPAVYRTLNTAVVGTTYVVTGGSITLNDTARTFTGEIHLQVRSVSIAGVDGDTTVSGSTATWDDTYRRARGTMMLNNPESGPFAGSILSVGVDGRTLAIKMNGMTLAFKKQGFSAAQETL